MIVNELYNGQGMGNQIWNIVVLKVMAERFGYNYGINRTKKFKGDTFLKNLNLGENIISGLSPEGGPPIILPDGITKYYREPYIRYPSHMGGEDCSPFDYVFWEKLEDNTKIDGIFQKIGYIKKYRNSISEWLKPNIEIKKYSDENICVINFRGNDYLYTTAWLPPEYYQMSMEYMRKINPKIKFVITTDDPINAKKFIPDVEIVGKFFDLPADSSQIVQDKTAYDYTIIYEAQNIILSSSTFCFWPAWINDKANVIAPKYWFDYKISNGWWRPDDSIVDNWIYIDRYNNSSTGIDCRNEYKKYKKNNTFYIENEIK